MAIALALGLVLPSGAPAEVVGHLTQVEGRVDLLKGGNLPAIPVKLQDGVESKDVLRTKSLSKAQITFIDNSSITVSPESRIAIEEYLLDPAQKKRTAVLNIFQGLAHVVVTKLFKVEEPDFVVKTHTAITGVRGTDFGVRIHPNSSTILNFQGLTQVANIFPEVGQLFRRAFKVAYSFGAPGSPNSVLLKDMQGTSVGRGMPPTLPFAVTPQDQKQFMNQMGSGLTSRKNSQGSGSGTASGGSGGSSGSGSGSASTDSGGTGGGTAGTDATTASVVSSSVESLGGPGSGLGTTVSSSETTVPAIAPAGLTTGTGNAGVTLINTVTVPPEPGITIIPATTTTTPTTPTTPTSQTYAFTQTTQSSWTDPAALTSVTVSSTGWGLRTGVSTSGALPLPASYGGYFTASGTGERTVMAGASFPGDSAGVSSSTLTGTVTGVLGSTLTGTATMTGISSFGQTTNFTGTVTISPEGVLTFTYGGDYGTATVSSTARLASATGTTTYTPGTYFTQTLSGLMTHTSSPENHYNTQETYTNWGGASGSGPSSAYYDVVVTGGNTTNALNYSYLPERSDTPAGVIQGVVSRAADGCLQGAATVTPTDQYTPFVSSLVTPPSPFLFGKGANETTPMVSTIYIDPADGKVTGTVQGTDYQNGSYTSQAYNITLTPQTAPVTPPVSTTYDFVTSTYQGSILNTNSVTGGTVSGSGWGYRAGDSSLGNAPLPATYGGYFAGYDQGNLTLTSGYMPLNTNSPINIAGLAGTTQMSGRVAGVMGQTLSGTMTFIGSLIGGTSFNYTGPVTIAPDGYLQFNYTGNWVASGGSGTASGTMNQNTGYHFTQTVPGTYTYGTYSGEMEGYNRSLSFSQSDSGSRSGVYDGAVTDVSGTLLVVDPGGTSPTYSSGSMTSVLEGVVGTSQGGASFGAATLTLGSPFNLSVPGPISLTAGSTYFTTGGVFVQPSSGSILPTSGVATMGGMVQSPTWSFNETYQGFRLSTGSTPYTLANVEGYGWGQLTGALPSTYTGSGYFVSQDLGTRAFTTAMIPGYAGVTGSLSGTLSGTAGSTLSGMAQFTGTNSRGTTFNYTGTVSMGTDGRLVYNYSGTWTNGSNTGTGSGTWTQVLGQYFTQSIDSGAYVQATSSTTIGGTTYSSATVQDTAPLGGNRTVWTGSPTTGGTSSTTGASTSYAGIRTSEVAPAPPTGSSSHPVGSNTIQGVVAGSDWQTRWGVATLSGGNMSPSPNSMSGVVTLDTAGKLTGQFVDVVPNSPGQPMDNVTVNLVSVPTGSGQTTSSFVQSVSGDVTQSVLSPAQATLTTPTSLAGTSSGLMPGNINANVNLASTAVTPTYVTAGTGAMSAQIIGAVGGPAGGPQTGVASMHSIKTVGGHTHQRMHLGTATHTPAAAAAPATLTTNLQGLNNSHSGIAAAQSGTVTVTPKP
ncbi:MAG: FecR domain-containing protein [Desulfobaccales bacterium]